MIRKHIVVLGAALAMFAASEAIAQAPAQPDSGRRQGDLPRGGRPQGQRGHKMRRASLKGLFRGIDLTQSQREQMKTVSEKYGQQFKALRESAKPDLQAVREARQRGDTAAARAAWARTEATRERMLALAEQQRTEVRALLTPEQQQTFDKNAQQLRDRAEKGAAGRRQKGQRGRSST